MEFEHKLPESWFGGIFPDQRCEGEVLDGVGMVVMERSSKIWNGIKQMVL